MPDAMYFNVALPSAVAETTIPVTLGCDYQFTVYQLNTTNDPGQQLPADFLDGDSAYLNIKIKGQIFQVLATITGNAASFFVPSSVCDAVRNWDTWQVLRLRDGLETPLVVGGFARYDGVQLGYN
jgi:hypothetical protein